MPNYEIIIPHINIIEHALYSPYHIWEHLYIRIISNYMKSDLDVYGITTPNATHLYFNVTFKVSEKDLFHIFSNIKKSKINKNYIRNEILIVKNEIEYLSLVGRKKLNLNFDYSFDMLMNIQKSGYSWNQMKYNVLPDELVSDNDGFNRLESIIINRSTLFNNVFSLINPKMKNVYDKKTKEILLCFCINSVYSLEKVKECAVSNYKLNNFLKHGFFSNIFLLNVVKKNNLFWLTIYTFTKIEYINYLGISLSSVMDHNKIFNITKFEYLTEIDFK